MHIQSVVRRSLAIVLLSAFSLAGSDPQPKLFEPGVISTGDSESHIAFTPDGKTLYFVKSSPAFNMWTIVESHLGPKGWSPPRVAAFSGQSMDADPFVTRDGKRLWFISNRPVEAGKAKEDLDLWYLDKTANGWTEPRHAPGPINSAAGEYYPTISDDDVLYFGSERPGGKGGADIYRCKLVDDHCSEQPELLGEEINSAADEYEPLISPDGSWLIFMSNRKGGQGASDLWISRLQGGHWSPAENLGIPINSETSEYAPRLSADRKLLFFSSRRATAVSQANTRPLNYQELERKFHSPGNGLLDIYSVPLDALPLRKSSTSTR